MKRLLFTIVLLLIYTCLFNLTDAVAQDDMRPQRNRTSYEIPFSFKVNKEALNKLMVQFEELMTCREAFDKHPDCFYNKKETADYLRFLEDKEVPKISQAATPMFVQMTDRAKEYLKDHSENVSHIELIGSTQRFGTTEDMKKITAIVNLHYHDKMIKTVPLLIFDFKGMYKIMAIDE